MTDRDPTAEPVDPHCLQCQYDLSDLPDGRCPECGVRFTWAGLAEARQDPPQMRIDPAALPALFSVFTFAIGAAIIIQQLGKPTALAMIDVLFGMVFVYLSALGTFAWYRAESRSEAVRQDGWIGWLLIQSVLLAPLIPGLLALVGVAHAKVWFASFSHRRSAAIRVIVALVSPPLAFGAMIFSDAGIDRLLGRGWSRWETGLSGTLLMRTGEAMVMGATILLGTALVGGLLAFLARSVRGGTQPEATALLVDEDEPPGPQSGSSAIM